VLGAARRLAQRLGTGRLRVGHARPVLDAERHHREQRTRRGILRERLGRKPRRRAQPAQPERALPLGSAEHVIGTGEQQEEARAHREQVQPRLRVGRAARAGEQLEQHRIVEVDHQPHARGQREQLARGKAEPLRDEHVGLQLVEERPEALALGQLAHREGARRPARSGRRTRVRAWARNLRRAQRRRERARARARQRDLVLRRQPRRQLDRTDGGPGHRRSSAIFAVPDDAHAVRASRARRWAPAAAPARARGSAPKPRRWARRARAARGAAPPRAGRARRRR